MKDYEADIQQALAWRGLPNSYFRDIFEEFAPGMWDNVPCSEISCCISYKAGNLSKIYVSNYAEGMYNLYYAAGRTGNTPRLGAFIWFNYGSGVPEHTGRVVGIEGEYIHTVEGNTNGGYVNEFWYSIYDPTIYAYGYPNYTDEDISTYDIRTESPAGENLPYYNTIASGGWNSSVQGNGAIAGANVLNNCVGYAQGRLIEIHNQLFQNDQITSAATNIYSIFNANAEDWYQIAQNNNINVGNTPNLGAVGVWYSAAQNVGHVAILENYVNGRWEISESHYNYPGGNGSWDYSYLQNNSDYLPAFIGSDTTWSLIGFIYPFDIPFPPPGPIPPTPEPPETEKKKIFIWLKRKPF